MFPYKSFQNKDLEAARGVAEPLLNPLARGLAKVRNSSSSSGGSSMAFDALPGPKATPKQSGRIISRRVLSFRILVICRQSVLTLFHKSIFIAAFLIAASIFLGLIASIEVAIAVPMLASSSTKWPFPGSERYPRFLVIGDWGRDGCCNQSVLAEAMARKSRIFKPDFIISTGDNFYEYGLVSHDDPQFDSSFRNIYNQPELINVPWHVALGNHDYGEVVYPEKEPGACTHASRVAGECFYGPAHQLDVRLTARDPRWHCERFFSVPLAGGNVEIFFIDTTPIIRSYADEVWAINLQQSPEDQLRELEARLALSKASWKFVVGHHPIRTNHRPDHKFEDMVVDIEPMIIKYGVQAYFAGHDHNLQHLHNPDTRYHHVTSGAGSSIGHHFYGHKDSPFQYGGNGFAAVEVNKNSMKVEYMGVDSIDPLFSIDIPMQL